MKELIVGKNDQGQRLDRFLAKAVPLLPAGPLQKYIRLKRIKVNGKGSQRDVRLEQGDVIQLYINDALLETPAPESAYLRISEPRLDIVYEDENILLVDKKPGMSVHPDEKETVNTLISHIQAYLYQKGEWNPALENAFSPALCNRIDRNTGGIVIAAKNSQALRILNEKIREREIKKYYLCIVHGRMNPPEGKLEGYLYKDETQKQVTVRRTPFPGGKSAVTLYKTLSVSEELSLVECELVTGRTHQIRAQFADAGHPLLGDGKYGKQTLNKPYGRKYQALYSYKLIFAFRTPAGILDYMKSAFFKVENIDFRTEYFGSGQTK